MTASAAETLTAPGARMIDPSLSVRALSGRSTVDVSDGWQLATVGPGVAPADHDWVDIGSRTTVAGALHRLGRWSIDGPPVDLDIDDHWFRCRVEHRTAMAPDGRVLVRFDGLATIVDVLWNGSMRATSTSMFRALTIDVTDDVRPVNLLELRCRSLRSHLAAVSGPRARWKTKLVAEPKLRFARTTMLGRMPAWSPPVQVVGPWRPVSLIVDHAVVRSAVARRVGDTVTIDLTTGAPMASAVGRVGTERAPMTISADGRSAHVEIATSHLERWWPHTHGNPVTHPVTVDVVTADGTTHCADLGRVGLRTIALDTGPDGHGFTLSVNGTDVFCRGGSLMPIDPATLDSDADGLRRRLGLLRDAGLNMVRITGVAVPATTAVLDLCDELGMLVWHDLMLANLDHAPTPEILDDVSAEVAELLGRSALHGCMAVVCGGSEIEQQAAMMGTDRTALLSLPVVDAALAQVHAKRPDLITVRTSPTGGHLPFSVDRGVAHYFGVGAYRRPITDARHGGVRFAAECLAFANVPSDAVVTSMLGDTGTAPTDPRWKARVPRDRGAGWDFDDVRDHYTHELFGVDPTELRWIDPARALAVGRATGVEVFSRVLGEWRRSASPCSGALVWFLNDLWAGAGWGVLDADGNPKAALHGMARACAPVALFAVDEGLNGVDLWCCNDTATEVAGTLEVVSLGDGLGEAARGEVALTVAPRSDVRIRVDEVFGRFTDPTAAYRFGPPAHDAIVARLVPVGGDPSATLHASYVPPGVRLDADRRVRLQATASWEGARLWIDIAAERFARFVAVDAAPWVAWPDHLDVAPRMPRRIEVRPSLPGAPPPRQVFITALNGTHEISVTIPPRPRVAA